MKTMLRALLLAACVIAQAVAQNQISEDALRSLAADAVKAGAGNPGKAREALDKAVKSKYGDFGGVVVLSRFDPSLGAILAPPYAVFRRDFENRLRKFEPTDDIAFKGDEAQVWVVPEKMTSPNIVKVVVQRDGMVVGPISSSLSPEEFKNGFGQSVKLGSGTVTFPMSAFAPGAAVIVTLVPETGRNIVTKLDEKQLAKFK